MFPGPSVPLEPAEDGTSEDVSCCLNWDGPVPASGCSVVMRVLCLEMVRMADLRALRNVAACGGVTVSRQQTSAPLFEP